MHHELTRKSLTELSGLWLMPHFNEQSTESLAIEPSGASHAFNGGWGMTIRGEAGMSAFKQGFIFDQKPYVKQGWISLLWG